MVLFASNMASSGVDGRRMTALRAGFVRALEGATGACGFEVRAALPGTQKGEPLSH